MPVAGTQSMMKLVVDRFSESFPLIGHLAEQDFFDFKDHQLVPGAVYVFSRQTAAQNAVELRRLIESKTITVVIANPAEGSETLYAQLLAAGLDDLAKQQKILLVGGGSLTGYKHLSVDHFLIEIHRYKENIQAREQTPDIYQNLDKPYSFLFLNGRQRHHRQWLIKKFRLDGLLDRALWTCLATNRLSPRSLTLMHDGLDLMNSPEKIQFLPRQYEVEKYQQYQTLPDAQHDTKMHIFNGEWGEIYLNPKAYIDTYFSVVTETVFDTRDSFRTEKIWKPIMMGHPWIAAANHGYYKDIQDLGFKTFGHVIDESFDDEPNPQKRLERISSVVREIAQGDTTSFLSACQENCWYNQQLAQELADRSASQFPDRFIEFLRTNLN